MFWTLYVILLDLRRAVRSRWQVMAAAPERGDMNISKAIYAALAVALGVILVAAITAAVNSRVASIK